jgi:hypothetical protein
MILLALLLATLGTADLVRPENRAPTRIQAVIAGAAGAVVLVLLTTGLAVGASAWAIVPAVLAFVIGWMLFAPVGIVQTDRPWPVAGLVIAALVALAVPQPAIGDGWLVHWYEGLDLPTLADVPIEQFILGAACVLFLVETANIVVRLMLIGTGPSVLATENTLQGGRILGPIERVFVLGMALAGQFAALSVVVAAKGILRFPEISKDTVGGTRAEYVLVGSFVSLAQALVLVPLF